MTNCLECQKETKNKKYCSHHCANLAIGRSKIRNTCIDCPVRTTSNKSIRCQACHLKFKRSQIKICKKHNIEKSIKNNHVYCKPCRVDAVMKRRTKVKQMLVLALGGRCAICGYDKYQGALHFHHKDPLKKNFGISERGFSLSFKKMMEEVKQCILICANCHAETHNDKL